MSFFPGGCPTHSEVAVAFVSFLAMSRVKESISQARMRFPFRREQDVPLFCSSESHRSVQRLPWSNETRPSGSPEIKNVHKIITCQGVCIYPSREVAQPPVHQAGPKKPAQVINLSELGQTMPSETVYSSCRSFGNIMLAVEWLACCCFGTVREEMLYLERQREVPKLVSGSSEVSCG